MPGVVAAAVRARAGRRARRPAGPPTGYGPRQRILLAISGLALSAAGLTPFVSGPPAREAVPAPGGRSGVLGQTWTDEAIGLREIPGRSPGTDRDARESPGPAGKSGSPGPAGKVGRAEPAGLAWRAGFARSATGAGTLLTGAILFWYALQWPRTRRPSRTPTGRPPKSAYRKRRERATPAARTPEIPGNSETSGEPGEQPGSGGSPAG